MLNYSTYINSIINLAPTTAADSAFQTMITNMIDDSEQRLYRELDLIDTSIRDSSAALVAGVRNFTTPSALGTFIVTQEMNIITPAGVTNPELGTRVALVPTTTEMLNMLWPNVAGSTVPVYFALVNQGLAIVGPWPDAAYQIEVVGTQRPLPISTTNVTTLLSIFFPDLFIAASMVWVASFQKNFGAAVDDPKAGVTWESHYQTLLKSANSEESRKRFTGVGWSSESPAPEATPPRT